MNYKSYFVCVYVCVCANGEELVRKAQTNHLFMLWEGIFILYEGWFCAMLLDTITIAHCQYQYHVFSFYFFWREHGTNEGEVAMARWFEKHEGAWNCNRAVAKCYHEIKFYIIGQFLGNWFLRRDRFMLF